MWAPWHICHCNANPRTVKADNFCKPVASICNSCRSDRKPDCAASFTDPGIIEFSQVGYCSGWFRFFEHLQGGESLRRLFESDATDEPHQSQPSSVAV